VFLDEKIPPPEGIELFQEARLSYGRMIWLLSLTSPPPVNQLDRRHTGRLIKRDKLLKGEG